MKKLILIVTAFLIVFLVTAGWFVDGLLPKSSDNSVKRFEVNPGETAYQIGQNLQKQNLIKSAIVFRIYSQVTQAARNIKPGNYELTSNSWAFQIINKLLEGPTEAWVTIPEGFRREEIANRFIDSFGLTGTAASDFYSEFINLTKDEEGYLFPDTYLVPRDTKAADVVKMMSDNFKKKVNFGVSNNSVILASILERETRGDEEKPIVAGILLKRIDAGWPLNADATIQYAIGKNDNYWPTVTADDLKIDSPYNSYTNLGLPPTAICDPGLTSIKAAVNPTMSDYWYYLHDKDGIIHYATTIEEQDANIATYLQ